MTGMSATSKIGFLVANLNRQLEKQIAESVRPLKLPIEQVRVIEALASPVASQGMKMSELAQLIAVDASSLTKVIERMVSDSIVYRASDPNDRRTVKVLLAPKGVALFKTLRPFLENQERELLKSFEQLSKQSSMPDLARVLEHLCQQTEISGESGRKSSR
ncbi:MarR family transcriptional regulator (plasmid) [Rhizobium sp. NIBRBAC000502774]|nr:MarR family transcriptional regulator [Rhizobium sp. NIBRBAC000502774]